MGFTLKFRRPKPVPNKELLSAFVARPVQVKGADGVPSQLMVECFASWGAREPLKQQPVIHTPRGPVLGGKREVAEVAGRLQTALMARVCADMRLDKLLAYVKGGVEGDAAGAAERMRVVESALESIMRCEEPVFDE